ncbi:hypothetical protein D3C76_1723290 [compost metagenome]
MASVGSPAENRTKRVTAIWYRIFSRFIGHLIPIDVNLEISTVMQNKSTLLN